MKRGLKVPEGLAGPETDPRLQILPGGTFHEQSSTDLFIRDMPQIVNPLPFHQVTILQGKAR